MFICIYLCTGMYIRVQEPVEAKGIVYPWSWIIDHREPASLGVGNWANVFCKSHTHSLLRSHQLPIPLLLSYNPGRILVILLPARCCTIYSLLQAYVCFFRSVVSFALEKPCIFFYYGFSLYLQLVFFPSTFSFKSIFSPLKCNSVAWFLPGVCEISSTPYQKFITLKY